MKVSDLVRSKSYLPWTFATRMPDLLYKMGRNRVAFAVNATDVHPDNLEDNFFHLMNEHCEEHNVGYWTYESDKCRYDEQEFVIEDDGEISDVAGSQVIFKLYFEETQDADRFVKNVLVLHKLSN